MDIEKLGKLAQEIIVSIIEKFIKNKVDKAESVYVICLLFVSFFEAQETTDEQFNEIIELMKVMHRQREK